MSTTETLALYIIMLSSNQHGRFVRLMSQQKHENVIALQSKWHENYLPLYIVRVIAARRRLFMLLMADIYVSITHIIII